MGKALQVALEINGRREPNRKLNLSEIEELVYQEMLAFHGINGIAISGPRALFKDLKLIVKTVLSSDGKIMIFRSGSGKVDCRDVSDFEQKLGEAMAEYIR